MAAEVVTLLSSDDEDDGDIQFICEKPAEVTAAIIPKQEVKEEWRTNEKPDKVKRVAPTLLSTSVTITKVEQESPASPDGATPASPNHQSGLQTDSDDDIICLSSEEAKLEESKNSKIVSEDCDLGKWKLKKSTAKPDIISLDSDNEEVDRGSVSNDICDESTNSGPRSVHGNSEKMDCDMSDGQRMDSEGSTIQEVSDDSMSVLEITDDEKDGKRDVDEDEDSDDKNDEPGASKTEANESEDSVSEIVATVASEAQPSCSKVIDEVEKIMSSGPGNVTEKLLNLLLTKITQVGYTEDNVNIVKRKIMKYYDSAPVEFTQSQEFIDRIKAVITEITGLMERPNGKDLSTLSDISDKIKEFLTVFQRNSPHVNGKLVRLYKMYEKLARRIKKLEEQEVESDDEYENVYVMQSRYEKRITEVYNKICELENKGNHADRNFKQEFTYTGIPGVPVPIQRALEKYYNKTKQFPDFQDVWKLVIKVNESDNLGMNKTQTYNVASTLFTDFGKKLKRRRQYDDFLIMKSRLKEDAQVLDPAQFDGALQEKLEANKRNRRTEEDVLNEFALKEAQDPPPAEPEDAANEEGKDTDLDKDDDESGATPEKTFVDSDEEIAALENVDESRRRTEPDGGPPSKRGKMEEPDVSEAEQNKENESTEKLESSTSTKDGFLENFALQPS